MRPELLKPDFSGALGACRLHLDSTDRTHLDLWTDSEGEQRAEMSDWSLSVPPVSSGITRTMPTSWCWLTRLAPCSA